MIDLDRMGRWTRTTRTWVQKSCSLLLRADQTAKSPDQHAVVAYEAHELLWSILFNVDVLTPLISDDEIEDCEELAKALFHGLRDRRRAIALANTTGRTPEEAAAFRAKAETLGARS